MPECPLEQENPHRQGQPSRNTDGSGQIAQEGVSENVICVEKSSAKGETDAEPCMKHAVIFARKTIAKWCSTCEFPLDG